MALLVSPDDAAAQSRRRAHLSEDLQARLRAGDPTDTSVIVTGTQARVDAIAARHGLRIRKRLESGAVLDVPAGRLARGDRRQRSRSAVEQLHAARGHGGDGAGDWRRPGVGRRRRPRQRRLHRTGHRRRGDRHRRGSPAGASRAHPRQRRFHPDPAQGRRPASRRERPRHARRGHRGGVGQRERRAAWRPARASST